jgi:sugar lactone lactonase YvrE
MRLLSIAALSIALSACSGGSGALPAGPSTGSSTPVACSTVALPAGTLTVSTLDDAVTVFGSSPSPVATLMGPKTQIKVPFGVAYGPDSLLYVVNNNTPAILEFTAGASGDCAPVRMIAGPHTALGTTWSSDWTIPTVTGIAFDSAGNLYVSNTQTNSILVYAPGASGDAAPIRTIGGAATGLSGPRQITFDQNGNLWVANRSGNSVTEYALGASGNTAPIATLSGPSIVQPWGVGFDHDGCLWVANATPQNTVIVFMGGSSPMQTIAGPNTQFNNPYGESFDANGDLILANQLAGNVEVFADDANGDVAPLRVISGLQYPNFVVFRP